MHVRAERIPLVALAVIAAVMSLCLCIAGYYWPGWTSVPIGIRFAAGVAAFGLSPGLLIAGPFLTARGRSVDPIDFIISIFTCSFSCNLLFNMALFAWEAPFSRLAYIYVLLQAVGYAVWGASWLLRRRRVQAAPQNAFVETSAAVLIMWVVLTVTGAALTYAAYANGSPPVNPEELVSLRKLAENPAVRYDNISFRAGDPSTYFFVPFQILIVGTSVLAHSDVILTYSLFWAITTLLSIVIIVRLGYIIFGRVDVAAIICLLIVAIGFFDARSVIYHAGIVTPYPNRYGFGSGVLLPLGLLLFWTILRDGQNRVWRWALLIYLIVETTFVHARETLLSMGAITAVFVLLATRPRLHSKHLARIACVLAVMTAVLLAYKYVNLALAPQLNTYVAGLTDASRDAAARLIDQRGFWSAVVTEGPDGITSGIGATRVRSELAGYRTLFVDTWEDAEFRARLYLPIVFVLLPVYALRARSLAELSLATLIAGLGLITASGLLQLEIAAIVGNPEIFVAYNIIFIAALFLFSDMAVSVAHWLSRRFDATRNRMAIAAACAAAIVGGSFMVAPSMEPALAGLAELWGTSVAWTLITLTIMSVVYRLARHNLPLFAAATGMSSAPALFIAVSLVLAVLMPSIRESPVWRHNPLAPEYPPSRFTGDLLADYTLLGDSDKLDEVVYPAEIIGFLRGVPPNQTVLSRDTMALLLTAPHFAAVVSIGGAVPPRYIVNAEYLGTFAGEDETFSVQRFAEHPGGADLFKQLLEEFNVDLLVLDPSEPAAARQWLEGDDRLRSMLQRSFESEGFIVYRVIAA